MLTYKSTDDSAETNLSGKYRTTSNERTVRNDSLLIYVKVADKEARLRLLAELESGLGVEQIESPHTGCGGEHIYVVYERGKCHTSARVPMPQAHQHFVNCQENTPLFLSIVAEDRGKGVYMI